MNSEGNYSSHLTPGTIRSYLKGELDNTAMHRVEMHLLDCEFCADAVEGFELSQRSPVKTEQALLSLRKTLNKKIREHDKPRMLRWPVWSAAAAGIALAIAGYVVIKQQETDERRAAIVQSADFLQTDLDDTLIIFLPEAPHPVNDEGFLAANREVVKEGYTSPADTPEQNGLTLAQATREERTIAALSEPAAARAATARQDASVEQTAVPDSKTRTIDGAPAPSAKQAPVADTTPTGQKREGLPQPLTATPEGGKARFEKYLTDSLRYPEEALENKVEGTVTVRFTVRQSGRPAAFEVIRTLGYGCDEEAVRLIEEGPDWVSPVVRRGQTQPAEVEQTIIFKLPQTQ